MSLPGFKGAENVDQPMKSWEPTATKLASVVNTSISDGKNWVELDVLGRPALISLTNFEYARNSH